MEYTWAGETPRPSRRQPTLGTSLGQTVAVGHTAFYVAYQVNLGQVLLGILLLGILTILVLRWFADAWWR